MSFLFIDRILNIIPGQTAVGLKHVTPSDSYLYKTRHHKTALYSCILGEAIGQLCSWNVIQGTDYGKRLIGGVVGEVVLHNDAFLGDTVILENTIEALDCDNNVCHFHGLARVGKDIILELKDGLGPIMPVADFGDTQIVKKEYQSLHRPGEIPEIVEGSNVEHDVLINNAFLNYDRIIHWDKGNKVIAQKNISLTAPFFKDHFPHRPVLPVTLMIQSHLLLGTEFLSELVGQEKDLRPTLIRRVKMNDFVSPGTIIITEAKLKAQHGNQYVLVFQSKSEGKRICVCEAEFEVI